jgi:RNA polymerase sigma-70 factor (ECF subfamily)
MSFADDLVNEVPHLRRFARGLCGDPSLADDLVQDCVERALAKVHLYDPSRPLRAWLYAVLRNIHVSGLRRAGRSQVAMSIDDMGAGEDAVASDQESQIGVRNISEALDRLPPAHREVIMLIALEDMSYRDVAEITGVPLGTVMSRLSRARSSLRNILEGKDVPSLRQVK